MADTQAEVIVIGAGAAGLAASAALARAGRDVLLLEARDRIGGRCLTLRHPGLDAPIELGAEFIHGRPEATLALLKKMRTRAVESTRTQRMLWNGRLVQKPTGSLWHNQLAFMLAAYLHQRLRRKGFDVRSNAGRLQRDSASLYVPDCIVIPKELASR